ncbi:hypothetical protein M422DRAFT_74128 [Sphaerobolus stellatus SS14]|nr:hypothetical protein M422DRAFT_74128 [Sphaerobolus stellatus SS14]
MSVRIPAPYISKAHTLFASAAFLSALLIAGRLHYRKIVKNDVAGYPEEWWPSVSATIGDWYPERSVFQILIALTAGPRFALVFCWWLVMSSTGSIFPSIVAISGLLRTLSCGGWVYITSSDDHDTHDILMIAYICLNLPWMIGSIMCTPFDGTLSRSRRKLVASLFFTTLIPLIYFFVQHKVHRIPGAYTYYSFCEWFLIVADIWFDSITVVDFAALEIIVAAPGFTVVSGPPLSSKSEPKPVVKKQAISTNPPKQGISTGVLICSSLKDAFKIRINASTSVRENISFCVDVYLAYIWWSIFTVLAPSLFYFSVWELAIAGSELSLISILSPILLGSPSISTMLGTHTARTWLQGICLFGLTGYITDFPFLRLLVVSIANISGSLLRALEWSDPSDAARNVIVFMLGLIASALSKFVNRTVNPVWTIAAAQEGWNKTGILLASLALWEYSQREEPAHKEADTTSSEPPSSEFSLWLSSIGLGGLIFSLYRFLADPDTLIAYSWTGYPVKGPLPGFHGYLTLLAMAAGLVIATTKIKSIVYHPLWMLVGSISAYGLITIHDWPGYIASLVLAIFLVSVAPTIFSLASYHGRHYPAKVYFTAWVVVCLFILADVWTVAYAFVPAGWLLRERTDIVISAQIVAICLGLIPAWRRGHWLSTSSQTATAWFIRQTRRALALFIGVSMLSMASRIPAKTPIPHHAAQRLITAGIWTVHFGIDDAGRDSQYRMRDLIKDMELDIVGLLETDVHRIVFGNRDLTRVIVEDLGYYVDIGPGPNAHTWGAVLLSKFPILESTHHLLPSPVGELAPAISAILDVWGQNITVVVAHNGQEEDPLDRELQSTELARIMSSAYPNPVIFLGYVVTKPLAQRPNPYQILIEDGNMHDIDDEDWDRWCEYILYRGLYRVAYARVSRSTITDTELQVGKFVVPKVGHPIINATREERYLRNFREVLPSEMWFPDEFLTTINPNGVRGHYYHVNTWPLYYKIPDNAIV